MRTIFEVARLLILEIFRKKDFYVAFVLTGVILLYAARLRFYNMSNTYRYLLDVGLFLGVFFASILTASLAARQFPSEVQGKTCHVLLSKPISRGQFVFGKFLGSFVSGALVFFLFFAVLVAFTLTKTKGVSWVMAAQTYYLFSLSLMILTALAIFFSFLMTTAANVSVTLTLFLLISIYGVRLRHSAEQLAMPFKQIVETVYLLIPHFGFFDMRQRFIHDWDPVSGKLMVFLTLYALCYSSLLLLAAWSVFRRKNIS